MESQEVSHAILRTLHCMLQHVMHLQATRKELLKAAEAHLDAATKATIAANESMKRELAFQCKECDRLVKTNMQLLEENRCLRLNKSATTFTVSALCQQHSYSYRFVRL